VSLLVEDGVLLRQFEGSVPADLGEYDEELDGSGSTAVPGLVDGHAHATLEGGARWIERVLDPTPRLLENAERNGRLAWRSGVRWWRDVGAPRRADLPDGRERAVSLALRDSWRGRHDVPVIRAAGTWIATPGYFESGLAIEVSDADGLVRAAQQQLDDGADLVKLYMDGPDRDTSPFTVSEVEAVVAAVHARGAKVTAHSGQLPGARAAAEAGVDALEHGFALDADVCAALVRNGTAVVSTLTCLRSMVTLSSATGVGPLAEPERRSLLPSRLESARESVALALRSGVNVVAGSDFGGGSARADQLVWEHEELVALGASPHVSLSGLTWRVGELLGEPAAGRFGEGLPLFLVHGDPYADPRALANAWWPL
jgi:imidazolonepropionase-like amidohydrolase